MNEVKKPKVGLVLAGGGGKGAFQIGVWKALRASGLDKFIIDVSGASVGALNAVLFAYTMSAWYPILCKNEYNAISFFCEEYERDFELSIEPKPDEILRVFMIYQEADKNTVLEPPIEPSPIRRKRFHCYRMGRTITKMNTTNPFM